jgi:hypothetical protein
MTDSPAMGTGAFGGIPVRRSMVASPVGGQSLAAHALAAASRTMVAIQVPVALQGAG